MIQGKGIGCQPSDKIWALNCLILSRGGGGDATLSAYLIILLSFQYLYRNYTLPL